MTAAFADAHGEPCSFVPNDFTSQQEPLFWPIDGTHAAGFSSSGSAFGWDVLRGGTPSARIGVLDSGIGIYAFDQSVGYSRAWHRDLPNRDLGAWTLMHPLVVETGGASGNWNARTIADPHGTQVAGVAAAAGNNGVDCVGTAWWGNHVVPIKVWDTASLISSFLRGLDWGLGQGIKVFTFQTNFQPGQDQTGLYELVNDTMEENDSVIFWAQQNLVLDENDERDQPLIVWCGSTSKAGAASNLSPVDTALDARAPVGNTLNGYPDPDDCTQVLYHTEGRTNNIGNSFASPFMAGMAATLWDALPAGLSDSQRRDKIIDIITRTSTFINVSGDWGQVNILNAYGRAPTSATATTGTGTIDLTKLWREEGTGITVSSDENVGGTVRVIFESVHPCPFDAETIIGFDIRARLTGPTGNATVKLKRDNGTFDTIGTMPVSATAATSEVSYFNVTGPDPLPDAYVDGSGNITVRIEVPGVPLVAYDAGFDQILVRTLRLSEDE